MHKSLHLLGLLRRGPMSGYDLHRIVRAHGELYADLKKANVYYLLDRLAADGALAVRAEPGARGPRGERLIYSLTARGRARFEELLRAVLRSYDPAPSGVDAALIFLGELPRAEALALLEERRRAIAARRALVAAQAEDAACRGPRVPLAIDHLLTLMDAELLWMDRTLAQLRDGPWVGEAEGSAV